MPTKIRAILFFGSLLAAARGAGVTNVAGAALATPDECTSLSCELRLGAVAHEGPSSSFVTRAYNGAIPGPTLRASAGDTLAVTLVNTLADVANADDVAMNTFRTPNTTNLHTHGLHVSSAAPGDDIFTEVEPMHTGAFEFAIPDFHMGGTHWYHPHHHGSTALQAGGGAAGLLIVEDAAGEVPEQVASMPEIILFCSAVDLDAMSEIQAGFNDALWQVQGDTGIVLLVNGQSAPTVSMDTGVWYRWRVAYAAVESTAKLSFDGGDCEMQLLAKDGIYLATAPRAVAELPLYPGARADVAVRCSATGTFNLVAAARRRSRRRLQPGGGGGGGMGGDDAWTGTALTVEVSGDDAAEPDIDAFAVLRPCYLADTRGAAAVDASAEVNLAGGNDFTVNGASFVDYATYLESFAAGALVELAVDGFAGHPFHLHINPYQIVTMTPDDATYFQAGDWHDTLYDGADTATVRLYTDTFTGKMVIHCHILEHEDQGMMGIFEITGTEGATYTDAETLDPTCYRDSTRGFTGATFAPTSAPVAAIGSAMRDRRGAAGGAAVLVALAAWTAALLA